MKKQCLKRSADIGGLITDHVTVGVDSVDGRNPSSQFQIIQEDKHDVRVLVQ